MRTADYEKWEMRQDGRNGTTKSRKNQNARRKGKPRNTWNF